MKFIRFMTAALSGSTLLFCGAASATVVFSTDFSSGTAPAEITGAGIVESVDGYAGINGFADNYLRNKSILNATGDKAESTFLSLSGLAAHSLLTVTFDLALIDSWDGVDGAPAPDFFNLVIDGTEVFEISVAPASGTQEVIPATATDRVSGNFAGTDGFFFDVDNAFFVTITLSHSASDLLLDFFADGAGWQGGDDESWAIDNLTVSIDGAAAAVPLPAALPLMLSGLGVFGFAQKRRRRKS